MDLSTLFSSFPLFRILCKTPMRTADNCSSGHHGDLKLGRMTYKADPNHIQSIPIIFGQFWKFWLWRHFGALTSSRTPRSIKNVSLIVEEHLFNLCERFEAIHDILRYRKRMFSSVLICSHPFHFWDTSTVCTELAAREHFYCIQSAASFART